MVEVWRWQGGKGRARTCVTRLHSYEVSRTGTVIEKTVSALVSRAWGLKEIAAQMVKNLPAMQETPVRSQGWEDPLEKEMATHSSILAWRITWTEEPVEPVHGLAKSQT